MSDVNVKAYNVVSLSTQDDEEKDVKNPAAVALGRLGGLKGGKIRAQNLNSERRSEIAHIAAKARWKKNT